MGKYIVDADSGQQLLMKPWTLIADEDDLCKKLGSLEVAMCAVYSNPDFAVTVDCRDGRVNVYPGAGGIDHPDVTLRMTADDGHRFFLGKLNMQTAMIRGTVKTEGRMGSLMKLVPVLKPMFAKYRAYIAAEEPELLI